MKVPKYKDIAAILSAKKCCRKMYNQNKRLDFLIEDDKYFVLNSFKMSGNRNYYSSEHDQTPNSCSYLQQEEIGANSHVMESNFLKGLSTPVIVSGRSMSGTAST